MEEHFKNKLKNHHVDWDKEELLGNLKQELSHDQSKFNWRWSLLLPLLFLATCWGVSNWELSNVESMAEVDGAQREILDSKARHKKLEPIGSDRAEIKIKNERSKQSEKNLKIEMPDASFLTVEKEKVSVDSISSKIEENENKTFNFQDVNNSNFQTEINQKLNALTNNGGQRRVMSSGEVNGNEIAFLSELPLKMTPFEYEFNFYSPKNRIGLDEIKISKEPSDFDNSFFLKIATDAGIAFRNPNIWESKEKASIASSVKIGYQYRSGLSLESGLEFQQIHEFLKSDRPLGRDTFTEANEDGSFFFDENMAIQYFVDSMTVIGTTTRKIRHNNKHTFLSIPLHLSFRKAKGKADFFGTFGVSYAIFYNHNGRDIVLEDSGMGIILDKPFFRLKNKIGIQLGLGVEYPIFYKTRGFVNLNYRRNPTLLIFEQAEEQFYRTFSLGAGVRYSF